MVDANTSDGASGASRNQDEVLLNLPRTRPQRSSARRASSRAQKASRRPPGTPPEQSAAAASPITNNNSESATTPGRATSGKRATARKPARSAAKPGGTAKRRSPRSRASVAPADAAPRQGFESEAEAPSGSVQPPGAPELVASAAELIGELAKAGISTGERLLKDVVSRLPLS